MEGSLCLISHLNVVLSCPRPPALSLRAHPLRLDRVEAHRPAGKFAMSFASAELTFHPSVPREKKESSVVSNSLQPHGLYSTFTSPDQNTGVGSLSLHQGNLPNSGIEPGSPALQRETLPAEPQGKLPVPRTYRIFFFFPPYRG